MRVLIVDAFASKREEQKLQLLFNDAVKKAIAMIDIGGVMVEYASANELSRYIYKSSDRRSGTAGLKAFDRLDVIFIGSSSNIFPWEEAYEELFTLVKMCFVTKKCLFGTGAMAHFLAFCCATNGIDIAPLNGVEGSTLDDMNAPELAARVRAESRDVFLDNVTGDVYRYDQHKRFWSPYTNIGFKKKSMQKSPTRLHVAKIIEPKEPIYLSKSNEVICRVRAQCLDHWLFRDVPKRDFIVRNNPTWCLDRNANQRSSSPYHVLSESTVAPLMIKKDNIVCIHCDLSPSYPETITVMRNFFRSRVGKLQHHGYIDQNSQLYLSFYSQSEAAVQRADGMSERLLRDEEDKVKKQTKAKTVANQPTNAQFAQPHECIFLRTSRTAPRVMRSKRNEERLRTEDRPTSGHHRKSNYPSLPAHAVSDAPTASKLGHVIRLELAKKKRDAEIKFNTGHIRPRSAPGYLLRKQSMETLSAAAHKVVPAVPKYDRFSQQNTGKEAASLLSHALTSTHNLRVFRSEVLPDSLPPSGHLLKWLEQNEYGKLIKSDPSVLFEKYNKSAGRKSDNHSNNNLGDEEPLAALEERIISSPLQDAKRRPFKSFVR